MDPEQSASCEPPSTLTPVAVLSVLGRTLRFGLRRQRPPPLTGGALRAAAG